MSYRRDWDAYIARRSRAHGLDPRATRAVARAEGLSGNVGDGGTSFGPFQLHVGGALPKGKGRAWAESREGIDYALRTMSKVARGKKGEAAVDAIVRQFERPADPDGEIRRAMGHYNNLPGISGAQGLAPMSSGATGGLRPEMDLQQQAAAFFLERSKARREGRLDQMPSLLGLAMDRQNLTAAVQSFGEDVSKTTPVQGGPAGGAAAMAAAIKKARELGLHVSENEAVDKVDPVHTSGSYHYRKFAGTKYSRGLDVSGDSKAMTNYTKWLRANRAREAELFYDPLGGWKHGKSIGAIGGHGDHVHVAY